MRRSARIRNAVWVGLLSACATSASFALTPVTLHAPPDGDAVRAFWMYAGANFDTSSSAQPILDFCAREGVNRIYCGAYSVWQNGTATQKNNLRAFLTAAHASGIRVEALMGDTNWQFDDQKVRTKIDQMLTLHAATPGNQTDDFDAVHFDVEFWIDDAWGAAATEADRRQIAIDYLDNVLVNARTHLDAQGESDMEVAVDLSAHLENSDKLPTPFLYNGTTQSFLGHVLDRADDVVIMSYIDYASGLWGWTSFEIGVAAAKGRSIQFGADIQPVPPTLPINSFADNAPNGYASMATTLEAYHNLLSPAEAAVFDGFAIFQYTGYLAETPDPHNLADLDGDADADAADYARLAADLAGPDTLVTGLARDCDLDGDGAVTLRDFARFAACYSGAGVTAPVPTGCER
ncbi:MAG TPA: hypothetical protein P5572_07580 [Phycisphaerae bacterium]|nr:hypothetical protein [Phycisphaerales bacterium]HRX84862.1 hypothetical protein [Phycisphaerae bacterium]